MKTAHVASAILASAIAVSADAQNTKEVIVRNTPLPVVQQGPVSVVATSPVPVAAQQSGPWSVAVAQPQAALFQVTVFLTAAANVGPAQVVLAFPRAALVEQIAAVCESSSAKMVRVGASVPLPPGFTVAPSDATHSVSGASVSAAMASTAAPNGYSGSFVPPTPVRILVASDAVIEFFRDTATASVSEYCFVSLAGRWID